MEDNGNSVYSFTTTEDDVYVYRVVKEASEGIDFIITTEKNTKLNRGGLATFSVRKSILSEAATSNPDFMLAGRTVRAWADAAGATDVFDEPWSLAILRGDPGSLTKEIENIRNQVRRLKNILSGKIVCVKVESF